MVTFTADNSGHPTSVSKINPSISSLAHLLSSEQMNQAGYQ